MEVSLTFFGVLVLASAVQGLIIQCNSTIISYAPLGCYQDNVADRVFSNRIATYRDPTSPIYAGETVDWVDWDNFIKRMLCKCFSKANSDPLVAIQFYGECYSGPQATDYNRLGWSSDCLTKDYKDCDDEDRICVGKENTNFVYKILS